MLRLGPSLDGSLWAHQLNIALFWCLNMPCVGSGQCLDCSVGVKQLDATLASEQGTAIRPYQNALQRAK